MNRVKVISLLLFLLAIAVAIPAFAQDDDLEEQENECIPQEWLVVANGFSPPDINAATAMVAGDDTGSSTIVTKDSVPDSVRSHLKGKYSREKPAAMYIVGGEEAIAPEVVEELQDILEVSNDSTIRFGGGTRFVTFTMADDTNGPCAPGSSSQ